jgi:hypothetical protein
VTVDQNEVITYVIIKGEGGRVRTISSRRSNGSYGKLVANVNPAPWLTRCRSER